MHISTRILNEVKGRMMEDIVLLETKKTLPDKNVFVLQFPIGEYDMVVSDPKNITCRLYEIKHSDKKVAGQARHLIDKEKCDYAEKQYGKITKRAVIYNGSADLDEEVEYINAADYLKKL